MTKIIATALTALAIVPATTQARVNRWKIVKPYNPKLERMAECESHKDWDINTGNGFSGGLQFAPTTWWAVGGKGFPHQASKLEQKYRAVKLIQWKGYAPWPVCGRV